MSYIYIWGFLSGVCAVFCEVVFRKYLGVSYIHLLPYIIIPAIGINYGIYKTMSYANHFLEAVIVFSFATATLRLLSATLILHEPLTIQMLVAYGLLVSAQFVRGI